LPSNHAQRRHVALDLGDRSWLQLDVWWKVEAAITTGDARACPVSILVSVPYPTLARIAKPR
jgi:hypothetical protein